MMTKALPRPESDGAEISVRAFIGTSGAIDVQGVGTPIQRFVVPIRVADITTIPALQAFLKPANVASGTLVDDAGVSWTGMTLVQVSGVDQLPATRQRATLTFVRPAP